MKKAPVDNFSTVLKELKRNTKHDKSELLSRFFKTGPGQYGEGDKFLGITVPISRKIAQKYGNLPFLEISKLLKNEYHEARLVALLILVHKYKKLSTAPKSDSEKKKEIVDFYLKHTKYINNWDLVDLSAGYILGDYLYKNGDRKILLKLAKSSSLWERRIAIISTFFFIYKKESEWTKKIVTMLMKDKHDLIHKACGWMLREVGKRVSEKELIEYLDKYNQQMPRTMLRYAIERLPESKRQYYLNL
ncbi:DNA alkylation repair protein [Candidatus Nomurabacteria bacterium]|nr:DNA alkylation repair protein [Candidatus Nomurabacteria bacterium]